MRSLFFPLISFLFIISIACSSEKGVFFESPKALNDYIMVVSGDGNTRSLSLYTVEGNLVSILFDYRTDTGTPRGVTALDKNNILVALDGTDRISKVTWSGVDAGTETVFTNEGLSGQIYQMASSDLGEVYVIEANAGIEKYDSTGARLGSPYISTTVGSCTLNNPRGLFLTSDNQLIVTNVGGNDQVLVYDVSTSTPTCLSATDFGNDPYGVIKHSNGKLYIVTLGNDQVYEADADGSNPNPIFTTDLSTINNPTAIMELPNGNLIVASSARDEVWEMDTSGNISGSPFIRDPISLNISDMRLMSFRGRGR